MHEGTMVPALPSWSTAATEPVSVNFRSFYLDEYPQIVAVAAGLTGDRAAAEDIAQEALSRAWARWAKVSSYDKPGAWVRRVAINLATSRARKLANETTTRTKLKLHTPTSVAPVELPDESLWEEVRKLPKRQAQAVALHYINDLPLDEIAAVMGCSVGTVKTHLHRARTALADALTQEAHR